MNLDEITDVVKMATARERARATNGELHSLAAISAFASRQTKSKKTGVS
jgi:hypothetical protein